jgi:outer membrane protein assembly factor BamB
VNVGGKRDNAGVVAFQLSDGKTLWKNVADDASYSSPMLLDLESMQIAIVVTRLKCVGLEVTQGTQVFDVPFGARGPTVNGASPVITENQIFLTSSYGVGSLSGRLVFPTFTTEFEKEQLFATQYATPIRIDGVFYGIDGRDDTGAADLKCFDPYRKKNKLLWTEQKFGYGTQILVDGKLLLLTTMGELVLVEPNSEEYRELARDRVLSGTTRALPAISNGLVYVRDDTTLKCLDLRVTSKP